MDGLIRLLVLLGLAGGALTLVGAVVIWFTDEARRIRRGLKVILKGELHGYLVAEGRGRGMGLNFTHNQIAVAWDQGGWGLVYRLDELTGVEVVADGMVVGRAFRGEPRRALDSLGGAEERVAFRLVFDDLIHPEFVLDLWLAVDAGRRNAWSSADALEEANRWLARIEALFRRPGTVADPAPAAPAPMVAATAPVPAFRRDADDDVWDDEPLDELQDEVLDEPLAARRLI